MLNEENRRQAGSKFPNVPARDRTLAEIAATLKKKFAAAASLEIEAAIEVVELSMVWDRYREEAEGFEIGPWLRKHVNRHRPLRWYRERAEAARRWGKPYWSRVTDEALVWSDGAVPVDDVVSRRKVERDVNEAYRKGGCVPLTRGQVAKIGARHVARTGPAAPPAIDEVRLLRSENKRLLLRVAQLESENAHLKSQLRQRGIESVE